MKTFVLVLYFMGGGSSHSAAITNIPGYESELSCTHAGIKITADTKFNFTCIPGPIK